MIRTFALLLLLPALSQAQDSLIVRIYESSHLERRMREMPRLIETQYEQQTAEKAPTPGMRQRMNALRRAFNPDSLRKDALHYLDSVRVEVHLRAALAWIDTPANRSIRRRIQRPLDDTLVREIEQHFEDSTRVPGPDRLRMIGLLDDRMRRSETEATVIVNVYLSYVAAMGTELPPHERVSNEEIPEVATLMHNELMGAYRELNLAHLAYVLRDVGDGPLRRYSAFLSTDAGTWYADALKGATDYALERVGERLGSYLP